MSEFNASNRESDGKQPQCRSCQKAYRDSTPDKDIERKRWASTRQENHRKRVGLALEGRPCVDCGETEDGVKEFDHVPGTDKRFNISNGWKYSDEEFEAEIIKCEIRCVNCHLRVTELRRPNSFRRTLAESFGDLTAVKLSPAQRAVYAHLLSHPCVDCGERDIMTLQFDHVHGEKSAAVSKLMQASVSRVQAEIAKCEVRCGNCHRRRTLQRAKHGPYRVKVVDSKIV